MKSADITPAHKKGGKTDKRNYRPVSVLPVVSKIFERIIQKQIGIYMEKTLCPYLCGYRKGFNVQHALLSLPEKWRIMLDRRAYGGVVLMDLSKAFDTLNHDLLISKLQAYGFDCNALNLIKSYLSNRWQWTKINTSYSSWSEFITGVPQGSVLGPLLFNIFINDLFYFFDDTDVCDYADNTTLHACDEDLATLRLECDTNRAVECFKHNHMRSNPDKCHLVVSGHKHECILANIQ